MLDLNTIRLNCSGKPNSFKMARWITEEEAVHLRYLIEGFDVYLESGTANGFSAIVASEVINEIHTYDPFNRPKIWDHMDIPTQYRISYYERGFEDVNIERFSGKRKAIFIDGDHGQTAINRDWDTIKGGLEKGDIVLFHDLNMKAVHKAFIRIMNKNNYNNKVLSVGRKFGLVMI